VFCFKFHPLSNCVGVAELLTALDAANLGSVQYSVDVPDTRWRIKSILNFGRTFYAPPGIFMTNVGMTSCVSRLS